jgi:hypothetical protein
MAAVQAWMARPWYQRAWFTWPVGWQVASFAFFVLAIAAVILLGPAALASATVTAAPVIDPAIDSIGEVVGTLARTVNAGRVVWTTVIYPLLLVTSPFVGLMFLLGGTIAVALNRVAFGRPEVS